LVEKVNSKVKPLIEENRQLLQEFVQQRLVPISK